MEMSFGESGIVTAKEMGLWLQHEKRQERNTDCGCWSMQRQRASSVGRVVRYLVPRPSDVSCPSLYLSHY